jgi:siroheme synthase
VRRGGLEPARTSVDTLVVLMGVAALPTIVSRLTAAGRRADTAVAVIERGATADQRIVTGTLADIPERAASATSPAVIVIGDVAGLQPLLAPSSPWVRRCTALPGPPSMP